jgi:hypothetical protein
MSRNLAVVSPATEQAAPTSTPAPRTIDPHHVGTLPEWCGFLGLPRHSLKREGRLGRLKVFKRSGRLWTTGEAVLDWLRGGEVRRRPQPDAD